METYGVALGVGLVILVTAVALLIGARAARSVREFRHDDHKTFTGRNDQ